MWRVACGVWGCGHGRVAIEKVDDPEVEFIILSDEHVARGLVDELCDVHDGVPRFCHAQTGDGRGWEGEGRGWTTT